MTNKPSKESRRVTTLLAKRKNFALICVAILLTAGFIGGTYGYLRYKRYQEEQSSKRCTTLENKEREAYAKKDWDNTINHNNNILQSCKIQEYQKVTTEHNLSVAYYSKNDKEKAKQHAKNGLKINDAISAEERQKIKDQYSIITDMSDIDTGVYYQKTPYKEIDSTVKKEVKR